MSAYLNSLQNAMANSVPPEPQVPSLQAQVAAWFEGLPAFTRQRPYAMSEIEAALNQPGRLLSPALLALGWQRKRQWQSRAHYHRYWLPPLPGSAGTESVSTRPHLLVADAEDDA